MISYFSNPWQGNWRPILVVLAAFTLILPARQDALAQHSTDPPTRPRIKVIKVLGIGNSFTGNAFALLRPIAQKCKKHELIIAQATIGGCSMEKHIRLAKLHYKDPHHQAGLAYWFSKTNGNGKRVRVRVGLKELLISDNWDVVTIQQVSRESTNIASYRPHARELSQYIKRYAPRAEVVLHQTWAYRVDGDFDRVFPGRPGYGQREMHRDLTKAYNTIAEELRIRTIPVGDAFQLARERRPFVPATTIDPSKLISPNLPPQENSLCRGWYWDFSAKPSRLRRDTHHAGIRGQFLAAAVWFEFLTGLNVAAEGIKAGNISDEDAKFLGQVAHVAVEQRARTPIGIGLFRPPRESFTQKQHH